MDWPVIFEDVEYPPCRVDRVERFYGSELRQVSWGQFPRGCGKVLERQMTFGGGGDGVVSVCGEPAVLSVRKDWGDGSEVVDYCEEHIPPKWSG